MFQTGDHTEEGELTKVEKSSHREGASKKINSTCRCFLMELHKPCERVHVTVVEDFVFLLGQNKGAKTREEDRESIDALSLETGSRAGMVV